MANTFTNLAQSYTTGVGPTYNTASISVPDNAVILVAVVSCQTNYNQSAPTVAISGLTGITWSTLAENLTYGGRRALHLFRGVNNSGGTLNGAVTFTLTGTNGGTPSECGWIIDKVEGADADGTPTSTATTGQATATTGITLGDVGTPNTGDSVWAAFGYDLATTPITLDAALTTLGSISGASTIRQMRSGYDAADPQNETPGATGPGSSNWAAVGLIVKAAVAASFRAWDYAPDTQQILHNPR